MSAIEREDWRWVNRRLVAKAIGELHFEEALEPEECELGGWIVKLASGIDYRFEAWLNLWDHLVVDPQSLCRVDQGREQFNLSAAQFFIDAHADLELTELILAPFLEELSHTLTSDLDLARISRALRAEDLTEMHSDHLQCLLDGHPKGLAAKGRLGWSRTNMKSYAPEYRQAFQLFWLAADRQRCQWGLAADVTELSLLDHSFSTDSKGAFLKQVESLDPQTFCLIPVHPWQWEHKLAIQFQEDLVTGHLVPLGLHGDAYLPQMSLRTLSNLERPEQLNIKVALSVLNTSCYRGIPGQYVPIGPSLSRWLVNICGADPQLEGTVILQELAGITYRHPHYSQIQGAPYRYQEMLGAIWRQSVHGLLREGEVAISAAVFHQRDRQGSSLLAVYIRRSGLSAAQWMRHWFEVVVIPLYHLMCRYGVGLVAHGQNITVILKNHRPQRMALKDFQGDLRLVDQTFPEAAELPEQVRNCLSKLPAHYLQHDLQTGHFVTVLRFMSTLLAEDQLLSERIFYDELVMCLQAYMARNPQLKQRFALFDLLTPGMKRVCINRVRFREGYGDRAQRLLPILGSDLRNPLNTLLMEEHT